MARTLMGALADYVKRMQNNDYVPDKDLLDAACGVYLALPSLTQQVPPRFDALQHLGDPRALHMTQFVSLLGQAFIEEHCAMLRNAN
jgi:hypothetical protein